MPNGYECLEMLDNAAFGETASLCRSTVWPSDPAAQWINTTKGNAFRGYATSNPIDTDNAGILPIPQLRIAVGTPIPGRTPHR